MGRPDKRKAARDSWLAALKNRIPWNKPITGAMVHVENYNYLNPIQLLELCCSFLQLSLWIMDLLLEYNTVRIFELSQKKDFLNRFVDILCTLAKR